MTGSHVVSRLTAAGCSTSRGLVLGGTTPTSTLSKDFLTPTHSGFTVGARHGQVFVQHLSTCRVSPQLTLLGYCMFQNWNGFVDVTEMNKTPGALDGGLNWPDMIGAVSLAQPALSVCKRDQA